MIAASKHSDFADWLSPMLVKELRQGMRSRIFVSAFYITQLLMMVNVVLSLIASANTDTIIPLGGMLNGLFWVMIGIPLLIVMPARGFGALHGELKARTLELVFLTHLSAMRIVLGKWLALMVQALLLLCSVLPYVVLRYFLGGVNILEDLQTVFFLMVGCATFTAVTLALSPYESKMLRSLFTMGIIFGVLFLPSMISASIALSGVRGSRGASINAFQVYVCLAVFLPAFVFMALEMAASRIAPAAENHALRKRVIGFYFLIAASVLAFFGYPAGWVFGMALGLLFLVVIDALSEPHQPVRRVYQPFYKFRPGGSFLALFFTPGWASASWFVAALGILGAVLLWLNGAMTDEKGSLQYLSYFGMLIFPAAIVRLFNPSIRNFLAFYIAVQSACVVLTMLFSMVGGYNDQPVAVWLSPLPLCTFLRNLFGEVPAEHLGVVWAVTAGVTALSVLVLLVRSLAPWRDIHALLRQSPDDHVQR